MWAEVQLRTTIAAQTYNILGNITMPVAFYSSFAVKAVQRWMPDPFRWTLPSHTSDVAGIRANRERPTCPAWQLACRDILSIYKVFYQNFVLRIILILSLYSF